MERELDDIERDTDAREEEEARERQRDEKEQYEPDEEAETFILDTHDAVHENGENKWCPFCIAIRLKRKLRNLWFDLRIKYWQFRIAIDDYRNSEPVCECIRAKRPEGEEPPTPEPKLTDRALCEKYRLLWIKIYLNKEYKDFEERERWTKELLGIQDEVDRRIINRKTERKGEVEKE